mgnify:CR=1 FL=1
MDLICQLTNHIHPRSVTRGFLCDQRTTQFQKNKFRHKQISGGRIRDGLSGFVRILCYSNGEVKLIYSDAFTIDIGSLGIPGVVSRCGGIGPAEQALYPHI